MAIKVEDWDCHGNYPGNFTGPEQLCEASLFEDLDFEGLPDMNEVPFQTTPHAGPDTLSLPAPPIIAQFCRRRPDEAGTLVGKMMQRLNDILVTNNAQSPENQEESGIVSSEIVSCQVCSVKLNNRSILLDHLKSAHKIKLPDFSYTGEGAAFECEGTLFTCNICDTKFRTRLKIENHIINHYTECLFCALCNEYFPNLYEHKRTAHKGGDLYACPVCRETFSADMTLYRHLRDIHGREFFIKCTSCLRGFADAFSYMIEGQLHGSFHFYCVVCHKKANSYQKLISHQINAHSPTIDNACAGVRLYEDQARPLLILDEDDAQNDIVFAGILRL